MKCYVLTDGVPTFIVILSNYVTKTYTNNQLFSLYINPVSNVIMSKRVCYSLTVRKLNLFMKRFYFILFLFLKIIIVRKGLHL